MKTVGVLMTQLHERTGPRAVYSVTLEIEVTPAERTRLEAVRRGEMKIVSMGFRAVKNEELKL